MFFFGESLVESFDSVFYDFLLKSPLEGDHHFFNFDFFWPTQTKEIENLDKKPPKPIFHSNDFTTLRFLFPSNEKNSPFPL